MESNQLFRSEVQYQVWRALSRKQEEKLLRRAEDDGKRTGKMGNSVLFKEHLPKGGRGGRET